MKKILITTIFLAIFLIGLVSVSAIEDKLCKTIEEGEVLIVRSAKGVDFRIESIIIEMPVNQATFTIRKESILDPPGPVFTLKEKGRTILSDGSEVTVSDIHSEKLMDKVDFCLKFGTGTFEEQKPIPKPAAITPPKPITPQPFACAEGCEVDQKCIPVGSRLIANEKSSYCDLDNQIKTQKLKEATCQNSYECESNLCSGSQCLAIGEKLGLLDRIASFLKRLFGFKG
ncbi:MAG: hypothetical protein Q8R00_00685 [Candidatus Nanoarchaeia archaeon]|nr:hypothetical protein [Candidatus Nanoarchaeia archaeon]